MQREKPSPKHEQANTNDALSTMGISATDITRELMKRHDPQTLEALQPKPEAKPLSPSLNEMREWLSDARTLGHSKAYRDRIKELAEEILAGTDAIFLHPKERDPNFRNEDFTLSSAAQTAMERDQTQARTVKVAQMGKEILAKLGKPNHNGQVTYEREKGNYRLTYDRRTETFEVYSKSQQKMLLSEVRGEIQHSQASISPMDVATFTAVVNTIRAKEQEKTKSADSRS